MTAAEHHTNATTEESIRGLIDRFIEAARDRSECDPERRRRAQRRLHRSWPLVVSRDVDSTATDLGVALYDASALGVAFLASEGFRPGVTVMLKLFWHDPDCPRVPAEVLHVQRTEHGYLVGCAFRLDEVPAHCRP